MKEEEIGSIINDFFKGKDHFERKGAFIWIAKHGEKRVNHNELGLLKLKYEEGVSFVKPPEISKTDKNNYNFAYIPEFETLTIEPNKGGQYEVAVRLWSENMWRGYKINNFDSHHFLVGINTRGH